MKNRSGPFFILLAAFFWSTAGLFTRIVETDIPTTLFWRSFTGGIFVLVFYAIYAKTYNLKKLASFSMGETVIAVLSTLGMLCFISSFFFTSIANVSFVYGTMPLVTYGFAIIFLKEKMSKVASCCCIAAAGGVAIMTAGNSELNDYFGLFLAFGMTIFMAALTVATKHFPEANTIKATYLSAFLGAAITLPLSGFVTTSNGDLAWLVIYGLVNVGLGFGLYLVGVTRTTAVSAALIGLIEIPLAPIWAFALFNESVGALIILGGTIIFLSAASYIIYCPSSGYLEQTAA